MILAGIDEAGYGPLLGPLVVAITVFRVPDGDPPDLWAALEPAVDRDPRRPGVIPVDDSKKLYVSGKGWTHLEEGLLPFLFQRTERVPSTLRELLRVVARRGRDPGAEYLDAYPWYSGRDVALPRDTFPGVIRKRAARLAASLADRKIEFLAMRAAPVEVGELNRELARTDNKAVVSFLSVGAFLRRLWVQYPNEPVTVCIDRQGGRTQYARALFEALGPRGVSIEEQGPDLSSYRLARPGRRHGDFRVIFSSECESKHLPVALASMLAKYVRETHMHIFNDYWLELQASLRPTAGYRNDAHRFLEDTADLRAKIATDESLLIRRR